MTPPISTNLGHIDLQNGACTKCDLCKDRKAVVNGFGNVEAKILFVTDSVGGYEEANTRPIQGTNGKLFDRLLLRAGLSRAQVFTTSVIRCKGAPKSPKELQKSIDACKNYLETEINTIKPNVIVPMGSTALKAVMESKTINITKERGVLHFSEKYQCKVIPIFHPAYLLQMPHFEQVTVQDLCRVKNESKSRTPLPTPVRNHHTITTLDDFYKFLAIYKQATHLAVDVESTGLKWMVDEIIGISFSCAAGEGYYIPLVVGRGARNLVTRKLQELWGPHQSEVVKGIKELLEGPTKKIFHNGAYDIKILKCNLGIDINNFWFDTMLGDHLLDENARGLHGLENCALRFTDFGSYKRPVLEWFKEHKIAEKDRDFSLLPSSLLWPYGASDADVTFTLYEIFAPKIREQGLYRLFSQIVMPIQRRLIETEFRGVEIDQVYLDQLELRYGTRLIELEQLIYKLVGTFKISSPDQLRKVLFTDLKLPPIKKTDTGKWSTDKEVLKELKNKHPVIEPLMEFKLTSKLLRTYVIGLRPKLDKNSRLHTSYLVHGTTTGRLASRGPNLQNIPARTKDIQGAFLAGKDRVFIAADFSQAEWRAWANFSQDPQMVKDCYKGKDFDIHKEVASVAYQIPTVQVVKTQRDLAKTIVFGGIYGRGPNSVAEQFKVPIPFAHKILDYVKNRYPVGFKWLAQQQAQAKQVGEVYNLFGRVRHLQSALECLNEEIRAKALRLACNSPIQGTIGDLNSIATLRVLNRFEKENIDGYLALTIHDALIFSVKADQQEVAISIIDQEMTRPVENFTVPMRVEIKVGARWSDVHVITDEELTVEPDEDLVENSPVDDKDDKDDEEEIE